MPVYFFDTSAFAKSYLEEIGPDKVFDILNRCQWGEYLTIQRTSLTEIKSSISDLMGELNDRVYRLFGLDPSWIKRVEESSAV